MIQYKLHVNFIFFCDTGQKRGKIKGKKNQRRKVFSATKELLEQRGKKKGNKDQ